MKDSSSARCKGQIPRLTVPQKAAIIHIVIRKRGMPSASEIMPRSLYSTPLALR